MKWQSVKSCNFCGGRDAIAFAYRELEIWRDDRPLRLVECGTCGLVRATPRPARSDLFHAELDGDITVIAPLRRQLSATKTPIEHRRAVEQAVAAAERPVVTLYDMGCGAGTVMMEAARLGIEARGGDANKMATDMLSELGFAVHHGFPGQVDFGGAKFDAVTCLNYLCESYEPFDDLKVCRAILHDGGALYVRVPHLGGPTHRAQGVAWAIFGHQNVHYFTRDTLASMIEAAGFRIVHEERAPRLSIAAVAVARDETVPPQALDLA
jgi:SAM-dependent methyltransferase